MGELKPCPFCGNDEIKVDRIDGYMCAWCTNCTAQGPTSHFGPDGTAQGAWNDVRCGEENAAMAAELKLLLELEQVLDQGMAGVGRLKAEDRHDDMIEGMQRVDAVIRAWVAERRATLT